MSEPEVSRHYPCVRTRYVRPAERGLRVEATTLPLVIEATSDRSMAFLCRLLSEHAEQIKRDIAGHGGLLLRGFEVADTAAFERAVLSISGMHGVDEVFDSEPGRDLVDGTRFVLHTNSLAKTGGTFAPAGFHNENFYLPDVPRYISFYCKKPSLLGGETGLIDTAGLYRDLPVGLRLKLERRTFLAKYTSIERIARRYAVRPAELEEWAASVGLSVGTWLGKSAIELFKPCVVRHPVTRQYSLMLNLAGEFGHEGLLRDQQIAFWSAYGGVRWALHRAYWRAMSAVDGPIRFLTRGAGDASELADRRLHRIGEEFSRAEIEGLASSMRRHYAAFSWRKGDVLILDNLRTAHAGMPGYGEREIRAMLCNLMSVPCSRHAPGVYEPLSEEHRQPLSANLRHFVETLRGRHAGSAPA